MSDELSQGLMVNVRKIGLPEETVELLKVGKVAPLSVVRNVSFSPKVIEKVEEVLPHKDTLTYQVRFCKGDRAKDIGHGASCSYVSLPA